MTAKPQKDVVWDLMGRGWVRLEPEWRYGQPTRPQPVYLLDKTLSIHVVTQEGEIYLLGHDQKISVD